MISVELVLNLLYIDTLTSKEISVYEVKTFLSHLQLSRSRESQLWACDFNESWNRRYSNEKRRRYVKQTWRPGCFVIHNTMKLKGFLSYISLILNTYQEIIKLRWLFGRDVVYRNLKHSITLLCILFPQKP